MCLAAHTVKLHRTPAFFSVILPYFLSATDLCKYNYCTPATELKVLPAAFRNYARSLYSLLASRPLHSHNMPAVLSKRVSPYELAMAGLPYPEKADSEWVDSQEDMPEHFDDSPVM
jgi:hypothetical protein